MKIEIVKVGYLETNCYILIRNDKCLIVDPGAEFDKIIDKIGNNKVLAVLLTHNHFDHVGALEELKVKYNMNVLQYDNLKEKKYSIEDFDFQVIFTPGHTSDSVTYYFENEKKMFVGDFIFKNNIGRCDLPTGDINEMYESIEKIKKYDNVDIYSGHGDITSLYYEIENNVYFK